jgi:hypothetical protein
MGPDAIGLLRIIFASAVDPDFFEGLAACMNGGLPRHPLPAGDGGIHMAGIELDRVATPSCSFGGEDGRAAAAKGIENDVAALRNIEESRR